MFIKYSIWNESDGKLNNSEKISSICGSTNSVSDCFFSEFISRSSHIVYIINIVNSINIADVIYIVDIIDAIYVINIVDVALVKI